MCIRDRYVNIGGRRIRVAVWPGDTTSTPLLLMNGIGGNIEVLRPFAEQMQGTEVIAFDVPGAGGSSTSILPYRLSGLARLVSRGICLLYTSPSPRDRTRSRMPSSA